MDEMAIASVIDMTHKSSPLIGDLSSKYQPVLKLLLYIKLCEKTFR